MWVGGCCRSFIPDEQIVWGPGQLWQCVLATIHYMPDHWRGTANKSESRDEVAQLLQYKAVRRGGGRPSEDAAHWLP